MDVKQVIEIINDFTICKQVAADDIIDFTDEIVDFIEQQEQYAELGKMAAKTVNTNEPWITCRIDLLKQASINRCPNDCPWLKFCLKREEMKGAE